MNGQQVLRTVIFLLAAVCDLISASPGKQWEVPEGVFCVLLCSEGLGDTDDEPPSIS